MPPMLVAIAHDMDVPLSQIAGAAGAYFLVYGLMQPIGGIFSNRLGLARTVIWCTATGSLATLMAALAGNVFTLTLARAAAGGLFSAAVPAAIIYVGTTASAQRRHREITDLMTGMALGTALSTAMAGVLTAFAGWQWAFVMTGCIGVAASIHISRLTELPRAAFLDPLIAPVVRVFRSPAVRRLLLLAFLDGAAILGALTFIPTAVESTGRNTATAAAITATYGLAVLFGARVVGRLTRSTSGSTFILVGSAIGAGACVILAISVHLVAAVIACVLLGFSWASMHTSLQAWATEILPDERTIAVSLFAGSLFAGSAVAAALGGPLAQRYDFVTLFTWGAMVLVLVGVGGYIARAAWEHRN